MLLAIERTWDAVPALAGERASLELTLNASELRLVVEAPFHGDPAPPLSRGSCPRLWEYEVVECFLVGSDARYLEVEMGPHGHYLLLSLHGRRNIVEQGMVADYRCQVLGQRWVAELAVARALVPDALSRLNAFAVHGSGVARRHLCWSPLPAEAADFHQIERFPCVREADLA